ncbi:family 78 glycoside hydrolase catalytic domain [Prolixibacteraceae bacterium Z1-6]|uniref:alpha-L-rhamnosidase n=1 Tax=Draconibacterium aestuarii TaxID=2998507 RepID=A0A9X3F8W6_9BACT|nr:family 78 glycoside hydrolase catalytic domain [Prolixibacteraceae bacterium Z1-6]
MKNKRFLRLIFVSAVYFTLSFFFLGCNSTESFQPGDLKVEYLSNPMGIDTNKPRFSWKLHSDERNINQTAYQLIISESKEEIGKKIGRIWDSGKVASNETVNIEYNGKPLQSNTNYYWRVGVSIDDEKYTWSEPAFFHTGILDEEEWKAKWITIKDEITNQSPFLRKGFNVNKKIEQAVVYVTAVGFYEFFLNGEKVGDHVLDPGITDYRKTILYSTYDVTEQLQEGINVAGALLGNGAWNFIKTEGRWSWGRRGTSFGNPALWVQLMITYSDGSREMIVSDNTWKTAASPISFNNLYGGEDYDAREELSGWSTADFDDSDWQNAAIAEKPTGDLKSQMMPPIKVVQTLEPVKQTHPEPGVYLFDLGQNIAGWWRMEVEGEPGQVIRIRGAETLNDSLFSKTLEEGDKLSTKFRYHANTWTDYTIKSNKQEVYEPRFFYSGFRYIEVTSNDNKDLPGLKVTGRVVRSANEINGTFESSDSLLNQIHRAGVWSQMSNMQSYPTDCPHREKGAYNGDGQVIAETSMHDFHMASFYTKWINDMRDSQEENGRIPNTSPVLVGGMGGGVAWGSAYILIPWWMNHYYQDNRILEEHYPSMKRYVNYLKELGTKDEDPSEPFIIDNFDGYWYSLGEWCAPGESDGPNHPVVNTFYYYNNNLLLSKIAAVLGHDEDALYYKNLSDTVKQHFNRKFFNPETALYGTEEAYQTYQLIALIGNVVPDGYRDKVFQTIVEDIKMRDDHLNTGIIGTKYLWPALVQGGENELAYRVATQTTWPSFGYWLKNDATTLLEKWSGENSHNHQMFGSITEYFYKFLAGIQSPMEGNTTKGYKNIHIAPYIPPGLDFVNASLETVAGKVSSNWKKETDVFTHDIIVPANSSATIALPLSGFNDVVVYEGEEKIWDNNNFVEGVTGVTQAKVEENSLMIKTGSGNYRFRVENK